MAADPPRDGHFAFWMPTNGTDLEVAWPRGSGVRRRRVAARTVPVRDALPELLGLADPSPSAAAWAAVVQIAASLVARGRLTPAGSSSGIDTWRAGPLDHDDMVALRAIAAGFPPHAHAVAMPHTRPLRVDHPERLIHACLDAVADTMVGLARPERLSGKPFSGGARHDVAHLSDWLATTVELEGGARLVLRVEIPDDAEASFTARLQLRSYTDPSLVVDAADLWDAPAAVLARLGAAAETDLLVGLRRGARVWPPLGRALHQPRPDTLDLTDEDVADLLGPAAEKLIVAGLEVLWPADLAASRSVGIRAVLGSSAPSSAAEPVFRLDDLLSVQWELTVGGAALSAEELSTLADAKRPLVRMRDRWIVAHPDLIGRIREPPRSIATIDALSAALSGSLTIGDEVVEAVPRGPLAEIAARLRAAPRELAEPEGFAGELRGYQRRGLAWLAEMTALGLGGILADEMGLGKTIAIIALHLHLQRGPDLPVRGPLLVICPASLLGNWEREFHRFAPDIPVRRYHGGGRHLDDIATEEVVLATYGIARRDRETLAGVAWGWIVADEAQHAKNPRARVARAIRTLPAGARVALTGTPIENRVSELWAILDWTTPGLLGPLDAFRREIAVPVERYRDPEATERLARLIHPFVLRRRKADPDVAPELPAKTETDLVVPMSEEQVTLYEAVVRETMAEIASSDGMARRGLVLKLLTALKQVCNHPAHYLRQPGPLPGRSGKLEGFDELIDVILAEGDSLLVFTQYVAMARLLERHLAAAGVDTMFLHGQVAPRARDDMVARFQAGAVPVFLLSLRAGGVGLNLTRARHVIHYDRWWNPAVEDQASDRAHRIGQTGAVQIHRLVSEGTVEDRIAALIASKRELAQAVVGSGERWLSELSDDELADLVTLRTAR